MAHLAFRDASQRKMWRFVLLLVAVAACGAPAREITPHHARGDRVSWTPADADSIDEVESLNAGTELVREEPGFTAERELARALLMALATGDRSALESVIAPDVVIGISLGGRRRLPRRNWRVVKRDEAISRVMRRATPAGQVFRIFDSTKDEKVELIVMPEGLMPSAGGVAVEVFLPLARDGVMRLRHMTRWRSGIRVLISRDEPKRVIGF